jgi:5-formyltetrahydrofolate cyclo-ligase
MPAPSPIPFTADKSALRRQLRAARNGVSAKARRHAGQALMRFALRHRLLAAGKRVGFYIPANGEIDVMPLLHRAFAMGVQCYLPIVPGRGKLKMWFSRLGERPHWHPHWRLNRFGIPEYHPPRGQRLRCARLQRLFMPMLGFDGRGYRIGMGGGYYDASLAFRTHRSVWRVPTLIGVAFSAQEVERIPFDPWDVPLDWVLTERGLLCPRNADQ